MQPAVTDKKNPPFSFLGIKKALQLGQKFIIILNILEGYDKQILLLFVSLEIKKIFVFKVFDKNGPGGI